MSRPDHEHTAVEVLAEEEIHAILERFEFPGPFRTSRFSRGSRRAPKARITDAVGRELLLKRRAPERRDRDRALFAHEVQRDLASAGVPAVAPIADRAGHTLIERDHHLYELFPFIPGQRPVRTEATARYSGNMLAIVHQAVRPEDYPGAPRGPGYHRVEEIQRLSPLLQSRLGTTPQRRRRTSAIARYLLRAYADSGRRADEVGFADSPPAVLHGDWHPGNLLVDRGDITGILDFEAVRVEPRVVDIANAALQFAHEPVATPQDPSSWPVNLDVRRVRAVLAGYDDLATVPLDTSERACIAWLIVEALIHEALLPVAATGRFADIDGLEFLELIERRTRWLRPRAAMATAGIHE